MSASIRSLIRSVIPAFAWNILRNLKAQSRLQQFNSDLSRFSERLAHHNYGGVPLAVWITDPVAEEWYEHDWPVSHEIEFLSRFRLKPGARVFDLGAHQCVVALQLTRVVGAEGSVLAVEAHPHNAEVGRRNRLQNGYPWLEIINAAVSDRPGSVVLDVTMLNCKVGQVGEIGRVEVPAFTIDELAEKHGTPDVILIDIEGHECAALRGAVQTLATRPDLLIEVHAGCGLEELAGSVRELLESIPSASYDLSIATGFRDGVACEAGEFRPFRPDDPATGARFFLAAIGKRSGR